MESGREILNILLVILVKMVEYVISLQELKSCMSTKKTKRITLQNNKHNIEVFILIKVKQGGSCETVFR